MFGFTLAFGAMFSKTWRVHAIFTNVKLSKKIITDSKLFIIVAVLAAIDVCALSAWQLFFPLVRKVTALSSWEDPATADIVVPLLEYCESESSTGMQTFVVVVYAYKGFLLACGIFLAWETRHVNIAALNDSKYVGISVYNVMITCVCGAALSAVLQDQPEYRFVIISMFVIFSTTATLCLVFMPKIIELRRNPNPLPNSRRMRPTLRPDRKERHRRDSYDDEMEFRFRQMADRNSRLRRTLNQVCGGKDFVI